MMVNHSLQWTSMESHPESPKVDYGEFIFVVAVIGVVGIAREEKKGLVLA
jgi:hypothetical protein